MVRRRKAARIRQPALYKRGTSYTLNLESTVLVVVSGVEQSVSVCLSVSSRLKCLSVTTTTSPIVSLSLPLLNFFRRPRLSTTCQSAECLSLLTLKMAPSGTLLKQRQRRNDDTTPDTVSIRMHRMLMMAAAAKKKRKRKRGLCKVKGRRGGSGQLSGLVSSPTHFNR